MPEDGGCGHDADRAVTRIVVENIARCWGAVRAVDAVSFTAEAGQLLVLLGPSGCGKSPTLRLIAGLAGADEGRILIGHRDVTHLPPAEPRTAMSNGSESGRERGC